MVPVTGPGAGGPGADGPGAEGGAEGRVTVLFFAQARQAAGTSRAVFAAPPGTTLAGLTSQILGRYGDGLQAVLPICAIWVNGCPASGGTLVHEGDEVALVPPVSGG